VIHHLTDELKGASCTSTESAFACGWDCKRSRNQVQCAQTPRGRCALVDDKVTCFDPPVPAITHTRTAQQ
jgi:hypothetical protein